VDVTARSDGDRSTFVTVPVTLGGTWASTTALVLDEGEPGTRPVTGPVDAQTSGHATVAVGVGTRHRRGRRREHDRRPVRDGRHDHRRPDGRESDPRPRSTDRDATPSETAANTSGPDLLVLPTLVALVGTVGLRRRRSGRQ
jgi:hypothetical protein